MSIMRRVIRQGALDDAVDDFLEEDRVKVAQPVLNVERGHPTGSDSFDK